jgi:hypothetical protein
MTYRITPITDRLVEVSATTSWLDRLLKRQGFTGRHAALGARGWFFLGTAERIPRELADDIWLAIDRAFPWEPIEPHLA